jgi:hypothetical protein
MRGGKAKESVEVHRKVEKRAADRSAPAPQLGRHLKDVLGDVRVLPGMRA